MKKIFYILLLFSGFITAQNIKSIQFKPKHNPNQYNAIARLGEVLELSFDDLDADSKEYHYKIEHMTYNWEPSSLVVNQYIDGFEQMEILDVTNSFNTLQAYTHYSVSIPNQNTRITKSGNYLVSIIDEDYNVVFTRKCIFYEDLTTVGVAVYRSRNTSTNNEQQTVQFSINHPQVRINYPNQEIKINLLQNYNWNTTISGIEPVFIKPNQLLYNHTIQTNFWAGNEFLNFDSKNIRTTSFNIAKVELKDIYHSYLFVDEPRINKIYTYNPDINGQFTIRTLDGRDNDTEADYSMIHFYLDTSEPYSNKDIYIYGAFNNYSLSEENKMLYNAQNRIYEASILLKQGFYNYSYITLDENNIVNTTEIDGSFYQTENEYTVIVYYKPFGEQYDRVIGIGNGYFNQNR